MRRKGFERFFGEVGVGFASAGRNSPVFGGGERWQLYGEEKVPLSVMRPLLTAVVFAVLPQRYAGDPYVWRRPPCSVQDFIIFADGAPRSTSDSAIGFLSRGMGPGAISALHGLSRFSRLNCWLWYKRLR